MTLLGALKDLLTPLSRSGGTLNAAPPADRFTVRRRQRMREGFVSWPARPAFPPQLCKVEDVSFSGARIEIDGVLPESGLWTSGVRLYLATENHEFDCRVAWQKGAQFGLQFQGRPQPPSRVYR